MAEAGNFNQKIYRIFAEVYNAASEGHGTSSLVSLNLGRCASHAFSESVSSRERDSTSRGIVAAKSSCSPMSFRML